MQNEIQASRRYPSAAASISYSCNARIDDVEKVDGAGIYLCSHPSNFLKAPPFIAAPEGGVSPPKKIAVAPGSLAT